MLSLTSIIWVTSVVSVMIALNASLKLKTLEKDPNRGLTGNNNCTVPTGLRFIVKGRTLFINFITRVILFFFRLDHHDRHHHHHDQHQLHSHRIHFLSLFTATFDMIDFFCGFISLFVINWFLSTFCCHKKSLSR